MRLALSSTPDHWADQDPGRLLNEVYRRRLFDPGRFCVLDRFYDLSRIYVHVRFFFQGCGLSMNISF